MNSGSPASSALAPVNNQGGPTTPRRGPPKFKQRQTRQFKSKPPKKGVKGYCEESVDKELNRRPFFLFLGWSSLSTFTVIFSIGICCYSSLSIGYSQCNSDTHKSSVMIFQGWKVLELTSL